MEGKEGGEVLTEVFLQLNVLEGYFFLLKKRCEVRCAPLRACFFAREAVWEKILTTDQILRGWSLVAICSLGRASVEFLSHNSL